LPKAQELIHRRRDVMFKIDAILASLGCSGE